MLNSRINIVRLMSFGFKYGIPNANYYFDVGFIKNPAREPKWNFFSIPDQEMRNFVLQQEAVQEFLKYVVPLIKILAPLDQSQIFAFGCNSGRHRSYILVEEISNRLNDFGVKNKVIHREEDMNE